MCERKDFLSNYCYIISIVVVVVWGYPSLVEFSCGLRLSGGTHFRQVCDKMPPFKFSYLLIWPTILSLNL